MKQHDQSASDAPSLRDLYPTLTEEELQEAEENLRAYVRLVIRIFDEVSEEPRRERSRALTENGSVRSMEAGRIQKNTKDPDIP